MSYDVPLRTEVRWVNPARGYRLATHLFIAFACSRIASENHSELHAHKPVARDDPHFTSEHCDLKTCFMAAKSVENTQRNRMGPDACYAPVETTERQCRQITMPA